MTFKAQNNPAPEAALGKEDLGSVIETILHLSSQPNMREILVAVSEKIAGLMEGTEISLLHIDPIEGSGRLLIDGKEAPLLSVLQLSRYPELELAVNNQEFIQIEDIHSDPITASVRHSLHEVGRKGVLVFPLFSDDRKKTLCLRASLEERKPTERDVNLFHTIGRLSQKIIQSVYRYELQSLLSDPGRWDSTVSPEEGGDVEIVGTSEKMRRLLSSMKKFASIDTPVLLVGETGTGKELLAQAIHERSDRRKGEFVPINCSAIPETLLESELFGHERGSFTGAYDLKKGKIERAQGGTLFLDEIGELPPLMQVKLLRFLETYQFERVGGTKTISADVRIIAATNKDLELAVVKGDFRSDLYFRLAVLVIELPPLRDRGEDAILIAQTFLQRYVKEFQHTIKGFNRRALEAILAYSWPGNVRELLNRVRRAVVMAEGEWITPADLGLEAIESSSPATLREAREKIEKEVIQRAIKVNNGNFAKAARELAVSRTQLYNLVRKFRLTG